MKMTREMLKLEYERRRTKKTHLVWNTSVQTYKNTTFQLQKRRDYHEKRSKKYKLKSGFYIWISNQYLFPDGTLKPDADLDYIIEKAAREQTYYCYYRH